MSSLSDTRPQRIAAIDALRGFDMFFLTGGLALVVAGSMRESSHSSSSGKGQISSSPMADCRTIFMKKAHMKGSRKQKAAIHPMRTSRAARNMPHTIMTEKTKTMGLPRKG